SSSPLLAQSEFGFVNTKPSGQPYLTPEESLKRLRVPPGFEVTLFAAEPDIINPISFTVDERGRLWVVECYEYPKRTPKGQKPRDRIKILEDSTGAGKADKVTVWAEGRRVALQSAGQEIRYLRRGDQQSLGARFRCPRSGFPDRLRDPALFPHGGRGNLHPPSRRQHEPLCVRAVAGNQRP